ncbi:MAG: MarR family transcriptional regulator [Ruminococcus sp.]|nr:MarR family transcriptional regulator [Ruminococcus sp.]
MESYATKDMKRFNHLTSEINAVYHETALKLGLSDSAMLILYTICNCGESCLLSDICRLSGISKQTINSALRKLEHEGIVCLENIDGRKKSVHLTEKGKVFAGNTVIRVIRMENEVFDSWTETERKLYLDLTNRFLNELKEKAAQL